MPAASLFRFIRMTVSSPNWMPAATPSRYASNSRKASLTFRDGTDQYPVSGAKSTCRSHRSQSVR